MSAKIDTVTLDLEEIVRNMTPDRLDEAQDAIVSVIRAKAYQMLEGSKYEDVMKARNTGAFFQVNSHTLRALGMQLGDPYKAPMPHQLSQEKILYYTGVDHTRLVAENYARNPWPNVGTIGHCDWSPYPSRGLYVELTPLQQAIKEAYAGPYRRPT